MDIVKYALKSGIEPRVIQAALRISIEEVYRKVYKTPSASFCPETNTVDVFYRVGIDLPLHIAKLLDENAFQSGIIFEELPLSGFPPEFFSLTKKYFADALSFLDLESRIKKWLKRLHSVIDGEVLEIESNRIIVQIGAEKGIMTCLNWVKTENKIYKKRNILKFYISKINTDPFEIYLSRSSIHLPALLLKSKFPLFSFKTKKRYIGKITFVYSDIKLTKDVLDIIKIIKNEDLNGEEIYILPFLKS